MHTKYGSPQAYKFSSKQKKQISVEFSTQTWSTRPVNISWVTRVARRVYSIWYNLMFLRDIDYSVSHRVDGQVESVVEMLNSIDLSQFFVSIPADNGS